MENLGFTLLNGGFYRCGTHWNKTTSKIDRCYKLYFPVAGGASLVLDGTEHELRAGNAYFLSGFHFDRQSCDDFMDVYWIHFVPESVKVGMMMALCPPICRWDAEKLLWAKEIYCGIDRIFRESPQPDRQTPVETSIPLTMEVHGLIQHLVGDLLSKNRIADVGVDPAAYAKMEVSIKFMDANFLESPSLEEISKLSFLAPNYFHRLFSNTFGMSPFRYMLERRMNLAKRMLSSSWLTVKEISGRCGYGSEFHFSRAFGRHFGMSPSKYRSMAHHG